MSVPTYKRSEAKLTVFQLANSNVKYLLGVTSNLKRFDIKYYVLTEEMQTACLECALDAWQANSVFVDNKESYLRRLNLQRQALEKNARLLSLINIAKTIFHIKKSTFNTLCKNTTDLNVLLNGWIKSDIERYKEYN